MVVDVALVAAVVGQIRVINWPLGDVVTSVVDQDDITSGRPDRVDRDEVRLLADAEKTAVFDEQEAGLAFTIIDEHVAHLADDRAVLAGYLPSAHVVDGILRRDAGTGELAEDGIETLSRHADPFTWCTRLSR